MYVCRGQRKVLEWFACGVEAGNAGLWERSEGVTVVVIFGMAWVSARGGKMTLVLATLNVRGLWNGGSHFCQGLETGPWVEHGEVAGVIV